jgi:hypothetical protein
MEPRDYVIRAVAFQHGAHWVAQCLEHDIATQALTPDALLHELERILVAHLVVADREGIEPFAKIPKAPRRFWEMYRRARAKVQTIPASEIPGFRKQAAPKVQLAFAEAA